MSGKAGLYVLVNTLGCVWWEREYGQRACRETMPEFLGAVVKVAGDCRHGACCAHVTGFPNGAPAGMKPPGWDGWACPWTNLRPLEDPDPVDADESAGVVA